MRYYIELKKGAGGFYIHRDFKVKSGTILNIANSNYIVVEIIEREDWETSEIFFELITITEQKYRDQKINDILNG